ncbi:hypothetical protein VYU27_000035 [Nannochloropsis oceanica]
MAANVGALANLKKDAGRAQAMNQLLMDVYGNWEDPSLDFPIPLSAAEAGPSMVPYGKEGKCQRRYLWTDAWGVLCFVSLAMRCDLSVDGDENRREQLLEAGEKLVKCVHGTLGQPRGDAYPMRMVGGREGERKEEEVKTPHGFIGLRTGKERALPGGGSDAGMTFDGMYYHYLDKWIFALLRLSQACEAFRGPGQGEEYLALAEELIKAIHPYFVQLPEEAGQQQQQLQGGQGDIRLPRGGQVGREGGIYWKVGPDMSRIRGLEIRGPSEDCLSGWVVYSLVKQEGERVGRFRRKVEGRGGGRGSGGEEKGKEQRQQQQQQEEDEEEEDEEDEEREEDSLSPIAKEQADLEGLASAYLRHKDGLHVTCDPLGWGLMGWKTEKLGAWAEPIRTRLKVLAPRALAVESGMMLPFRLYGAIMGARLLSGREGGEERGRAVGVMAERALEIVTPVGLKEERGGLRSINKVMLAAALDPIAFLRLDREEVLELPGGGREVGREGGREGTEKREKEEWA